MEHARSEMLRLIESSSQPSLRAAAGFFLALHTADILEATDKLAVAVAYELLAPLRTQVDAYLVAVRAALGGDAFASACDRGRQLDLAAAFAPFLTPITSASTQM